MADHVEQILRELDEDDREGTEHVNGAVPEPTDAELIWRALFMEAEDPRHSTGKARDELPGTSGLLYRGVAHLLFGDQGQGKSWAALMLAFGVVAAGSTAVYFDRENGAALMRENVQAVLAARDDEQWPEGLEIRCHPQIDRSWPPEAFADALIDYELVVFDSMREFLTMLGYDPDLEKDVSKFLAGFVKPLTRRGIAVVILHNVGNEEKGRPKGSRTKLDGIPQGFKVHTGSTFSQIEQGTVEVECVRSRYGDIARKWSMAIGDGSYEPLREHSESPSAQRARKMREQRKGLRRACLAALAEEQPLGYRRLIEDARRHGAEGRQTTLKEQLKELAAEPGSGIEQTDDGYVLEGGTQPAGAPPVPPLRPVGVRPPNTTEGGKGPVPGAPAEGVPPRGEKATERTDRCDDRGTFPAPSPCPHQLDGDPCGGGLLVDWDELRCAKCGAPR